MIRTYTTTPFHSVVLHHEFQTIDAARDHLTDLLVPYVQARYLGEAMAEASRIAEEQLAAARATQGKTPAVLVENAYGRATLRVEFVR